MEVFLILVMLSLLSGHVSPPGDDVQREGYICPTYQFNNLTIPSPSHTHDIDHVQVIWMLSSKTMWNVIGWSQEISADASRLTVDVIINGYEFLGRSLSIIHLALDNLSWENCHHIFTFLLMFCGVLYSFYLFANLSYVLGSATLEFFVTSEQVSDPVQQDITPPPQVLVYKPKPKPKQEQMPKKKRKKHPKRKNNNKKR